MDFKNLVNQKILGGKYKIIREITQGGMDSIIYLAENTNYNSGGYYDSKYKYAAVKIIKKTDDATNDQWVKLSDEGTTTGRLASKKNIIQLYDFTKYDDETIIIVMEYVNGPSLSKYIIQKGWLNPLEAIWIFREVLIAIQQLHANNKVIIHRDLKPDNILLSRDLTKVRLIDFGISSVIEKSYSQQNGSIDILTNEESFYGTVPYLSPDILKFKGKDPSKYGHLITKQFDFFSLGIILHEMLTGIKPFHYEDEDNPSSIKIALEYDIPYMKNINSQVTHDLENMITKMITSNPEYIKYRYNDVSEIISDLNRCEEKINKGIEEDELLIPLNKRRLQEIKNNSNLKIIKNNKSKFIIMGSCISIFLFIITLFIVIFHLLGYF